ncbi:DUF6709 family protein [Clostridium intestinale]|uniref:Uncharacterized protein n=1 Tax=Clostridium intestinale TaxID=36845 RepID=A0A7D6VNN9_9CLOT|nr:DUF6709 family protein [Clostridium intestinale]QLY79087.1 hypothetical protein HZF06_18665 [Clostridium intestinale]
MNNSYFMRIYRKGWIRRIIGIVIFLIVILSIIGIGTYEYKKRTNNPFLLNTLKNYDNALKNDYYVKITGSNIYDLNIILKSPDSDNSDNSTLYYLVGIPLEDKLLISSLPENIYKTMLAQADSDYVLTGKLKLFSSNHLDTLKNYLSESGISPEEFDTLILKGYIDYEDPSNSLSFSIFIAFVIFIIALIIYIPIFIKNKKALQSLLRYFDENLENACTTIDMDINCSPSIIHQSIKLTKNFILVDSHDLVLALPLKEVMWVYKSEVKRKLFYLITINKKYNLELVFSDNSRFKICISRTGSDGSIKVDRILEDIHKSTPVIIGYSKELRKLLRKNPKEFKNLWIKCKYEFNNTKTH